VFFGDKFNLCVFPSELNKKYVAGNGGINEPNSEFTNHRYRILRAVIWPHRQKKYSSTNLHRIKNVAAGINEIRPETGIRVHHVQAKLEL
jgi:hypothetical protein